MPAIVNLIYMPIAVLMIIFAPKAMVHGMFYNKVTKSWTGKRWQHRTAYIVWTAIIFFIWSIFLMPGMYVQIGNFFDLVTGKYKFIESQNILDERPKNINEDEFVIVYEVLSGTSPEEIVNDILPQIIERQGRFSELRAFADFFFKIKNYTIQYDIKRGLYLVCVKRIVVAEVEVKNTLLFKKIYFHGYCKMYRKSQED